MILIVAGNPNIARIWARHLERQGNAVTVACSEREAVDYMRDNDVDVIVLDMLLTEGSAFFVADYANYRQPDAKIVSVTQQSFFSDGSLFQHIPNTAAVIQIDAPPRDLAEIVAYHGRAC